MPNEVHNPARKKRGAVMLEMALLSPWVIFLFIGALDWGFYAYSLITLETATRSGALYAAAQSSINSTVTSATCTIVINEMASLTNMGSVSSCSSSPLTVSTTQVTGPDNHNAAQVSVTYTTSQMIPIPGLLAGQFTITRVVTMRIG